jgi:hypothetical protein
MRLRERIQDARPNHCPNYIIVIILCLKKCGRREVVSGYMIVCVSDTLTTLIRATLLIGDISGLFFSDTQQVNYIRLSTMISVFITPCRRSANLSLACER